MKKNPGICTVLYPKQVSFYIWVWIHVRVQSKLWNVEITATLAKKKKRSQKKDFLTDKLGEKCGKVKVGGSK